MSEIIFQPSGIKNLYVLEEATGWVAYLLPEENTESYDSISLNDSLDKYHGSYLFAPQKPDIEASNFSSSIWIFLNTYYSSESRFNKRSFLWLNADNSVKGIDFAQVIVFTKYNYWGTTNSTRYELNSQRLLINESIFMAIPPFSKISIENDQIKIARMPTSISKNSRYGLFLNNSLKNTFIRLGKIDSRGVDIEKPLTIPMKGFNRGCLQFDLSFPFTFKNPQYFVYDNDKYPYEYSNDHLDEYTILESGVKYFYRDDEKKEDAEIVYPLFDEETPSGFLGSLDFSDIFNLLNPRRSYFAFTGKNIVNQKEKGTTVLPTLFTTNFGQQISLSPVTTFDSNGSPTTESALIVFSKAPDSLALKKKRYYWTLQGEFIFNTVKDTTENSPTQMLLCGISGTETINFNTKSPNYQGDRIAFTPKKPAYSVIFRQLGNSNKSIEKTTLLTNKYTTAWATIKLGEKPLKNAVNNYFSQPNSAPLFETGKQNGILDHVEIPSANLIALNPLKGESFPLAPSSLAKPITGTLNPNDPGYYTQEDITQFEIDILNPVRKKTIADYYKDYKKQMVRAKSVTEEDCPIENLTTTPQGFLVNLTSDKTEWKCLTLANNDKLEKTNPLPPLRFKNIDSKNDITGLQSAFQTNEQFLVISNPNKPNDPEILQYYIDNFQDQISIADWPFLLDVAHQNTESNTTAEFTNIIIFKFCSKSIEERIKDPNLWTDPDTFNDPQKIPRLIDWIKAYIKTARKSVEDSSNDAIQSQGFKKFISIIEDENWQGVLSLQVTLKLENLPSEIKAILGGIDISRFAAHHLGIEANQIKTNTDNRLDVDFKSSLFGMISYFNATYLAYQNGTIPVPTVYPKSPEEYDFQVLDLQVLFENSLISDFNSKIQLNLNTAFDELVISESASGNGAIYKNSVVMIGQYDKKNGSTSYTFSVAYPNSLTLSSTAIETVTIEGIDMSTVNDTPSPKEKTKAKSENAMITTRFTISGNLKFQQIKDFDLFSYDGLLFEHLILDMTFNLDKISPIDNTPKKTFTFNPENVIFKRTNSITRPESLVPHFPIELENLLYHTPTPSTEGQKSITPSSLGYLKVDAPIPTAPVGEIWYALRFNLNLGSIGALASKVGFNAEVILAWSPGKLNNQAQIYAKMPFSGGAAGTGFSIEGVLKFAIGSILLFNDPKTNQYSMIFTEVGVSLLGKKLPPNGSTILYLFGNPDNPTADDSGKSNLGWFGAYKSDKKQKQLENTKNQF